MGTESGGAVFGIQPSEPQWLAGGLLGRNGCGLGRGAGTQFVAGGFEIGMQRIQSSHGHLGAPGLHLFFAPASIEADGAGDVFWEGLAKISFATEYVADQPSRAHIENVAAGLPSGIVHAQKYFASVAKLGTVIPRLR